MLRRQREEAKFEIKDDYRVSRERLQRVSNVNSDGVVRISRAL
jgi:hypothetical protein